ncbi:MAG: ABC transporter ATP-binding protein [Methylobacteriaceae bacterium]|nr:ABC transporter ATP-binding protein [Methylobacteriaceae bacterium]
MDAALRIENLSIEYRTARGLVRAVDGVSFVVPQGAIVGLVGESGCGKTTVARAITGVMHQNARFAGGRIVFKGEDLIAGPPGRWLERRWRDISFIPQSAMNSLDPVYRIGAQIAEVLIHRGDRSRAAAQTRARELFDMVGLNPARLDDYPHQFSGGMRQRVAIALALALEPSLVIADEPVTALDVIVQRQILDVIRELQRKLALSMILVTHDISVVAYLADSIVAMYAGRVVETGATADLLERPRHPYMMGLTNAFPDLDAAARELVPIDGSPPDLLDPPPGCRFAPRCPFALPRCAEEAPHADHLSPDTSVACHRAGEAAALRALAQAPATWARA